MASRGRRPTIVDIAKRAGVSFKTVSRVLNEHPRVDPALRTRVLAAVAELDYRPNLAARSLAGRRGYAIALLIDRTELFSDEDANSYFAPYLVDLQAGALLACREAGYHFFIEPYDPHSPSFPNDLRAQLSKLALDGVILAPPSADRRELLDALDVWDIPCVRLAPGIDIDRTASVATDEYRGTLAIADHLLSLGHRRIGFVGGPESHIAAGIRLVAFREAVAGKAELIVHAGDFTFAGGLAAGQALLGTSGRPTAVFAANDFMAGGVVAAATRLGLHVPNDVSIAGFDDSAIARFIWPPLTTVRQPIRKMAYAAIEYLVALAAGCETPPPRIELRSQLIERESTGHAPGSARSNEG
jgi:LacI family transcriptional regulator